MAELRNISVKLTVDVSAYVAALERLSAAFERLGRACPPLGVSLSALPAVAVKPSLRRRGWRRA